MCENCEKLIVVAEELIEAIDVLNHARDDHPNPVIKLSAYTRAFTAQDKGRALIKSMREMSDG
jgi:hypothetical protein